MIGSKTYYAALAMEDKEDLASSSRFKGFLENGDAWAFWLCAW